MGSPTPVIREVSLPERTFQLVRDVVPFYARFYEKVRCWHDVMFSQAALWRYVVVQFGHNLGSVGDMMLKSNDVLSW